MKSTDSLQEQYSLTKTWPLYFTFFVSYIVIGYLLSSISFQSQIVPIWLPAGIALVGCYLWWWRFLPAVFLASFIFNFAISPHIDETLSLSNLMIQSAIIASGAGLQALAGSALLRYWLGNPISQWQNKKTLYFTVIVALLVNLISAAIGVASLTFVSTGYPIDDFQLNLTFWWLGDSLGVLLALPFILSLLNFKTLKIEQRKARWIILSSVSAMFILIILLTKFFIDSSNSNANDLVKREAKVIENGIYRQISTSIEQLSSLANFVQHSPNISRVQFNGFVDRLMQNSNTLKAMSWNPLISQKQKTSHESQLTELYQKTITIRGKPLLSDDDLVYVKLISPEKSNSKAIGFNVYSNPSRKQTLDSTMENYQPKATSIIQLVQSFKAEPAFLLFFPVFELPAQVKSTTNRELIGFATGVFLAEKIITNAMSDTQQKLFNVEMFELDKKQSFFSNYAVNNSKTKNKNNAFSLDFNVAGQSWNMQLFVNDDYLIQQKHQEFLQFFLLLVIVATVIVTSILLMNNRQLQLNNLVNQRTESLNKAMQEAKYANTAKSQFLANMSHEIRTPMNSVIGFAQLAKASNDIDEIKSHLEHIDISSDLLLHIINNILDISKIESEKLFLIEETIDLHVILHRIHTLFSVEASNKKLTWHLRDKIPAAVTFLGDQTRIEQILMNLCGNAMKFTQQGGVSITADLLEVVDGKAHIAIKVKDSGIGISKQQMAKLFKPFTQADASTSRDFGGTGLGLTIAKNLSKLMAGDIRIESKLGLGASFTFTCQLPINQSKIKTLAKPNEPFQQLSEQQHLASNSPQQKANQFKALAQLRVLVAEDNRINQLLIDTVLTKLGINAVIVENGQLAVDYLKKESVDVVLMDCHMPVLDGFQATKQIRAMENYADLPIFAITADVDSRKKEKALSLGFTKYLAKPMDIDQLTDSLLELSNLSMQK